MCEWSSSRCVSDSSRYISSRAQYAARRLVVVKDEALKGTVALTGHCHASPSHDGAAHTRGTTSGFRDGCFSQCVWMRPPWWPHGRDFLATRRVHPSQAQLATVWPRRSPSLPQASGQLRPSPRRQPALQLLRGDDHTTAGIRAPFRCLQGALASQLRSGIKHERPCTSGLQEASRAQIFYSLVPHPHCSGAAHDLEVSGDASFLLSRLVSPISVGR